MPLQSAADLSTLFTSLLHQPVEAQVAPHDELPLLLSQGKVDLAWLSASTGSFTLARIFSAMNSENSALASRLVIVSR